MNNSKYRHGFNVMIEKIIVLLRIMVGTVFSMFIYTYEVSLIFTYQIQFHVGKFSNKKC